MIKSHKSIDKRTKPGLAEKRTQN